MRARVIRVRVDRREATVATDAAIGDTVLYVKDAGDLTAPGTVQVNDDAGTLLDYTSVTLVEDDDPTDLDSPDAVALAEPLAVAIDAKTTLYVYEAPTDADDPDDPRVAEVVALCVPEGDEDAAETGEPIRAIVPREHQDDLPAGARPDPGVPVVLEWDDDVEVWTVVRIRGKGSRAIRFEHAEPAYTPTSDELDAGTFTRQLLHRNIAAEHGLFTQINGVTLGSEWWSLDADAGLVTVTIPPWVADAPAERREFGWPMYAYRRGLAVTPPEVVLPEPVAVSYVGSNPVANGPTSVAFPAGVLAGDLAVAVALGRTAGNPRIDDTRFATRSYTLDGGDTIVIGTWVVDVDSPSAVDLNAPDLGGVQDGVGMVYVVRPAAPIAFLDPPTDTGVQSVGSPFEIPGFASASGSIVVLCTLGGIGGAYSWALDGTHVAFTPSSYALIYAGFMDERPTVSSATATPGLGTYARGFQIGLGLA